MNKIKAEKEISDFVIIVFHGGNEFNSLPSPDTKERYRFICDMGADVVIAGHTHCPQGYETYNGKPIIYSMGNFFFRNANRTDNKDSWYYGYFAIVDINSSQITFDVNPYKFDVLGTKINVFKNKDKAVMSKYIDDLSEIIQDPYSFALLGVQVGLFSLAGLFAKAFIVDGVIESLNVCKYFIVITKDKDKITNYIMSELCHGVTTHKCVGEYTGDVRYMIHTVCKRVEAIKLKSQINLIDEDAFVIVAASNEIIGRGFRGV